MYILSIVYNNLKQKIIIKLGVSFYNVSRAIHERLIFIDDCDNRSILTHTLYIDI